MSLLADDLALLVDAEVGDGHPFTFTSASPSVCVIARGERAVTVRRAVRGLLLHFHKDHLIMAHGHTEEVTSAVRACCRWLDESDLQQLGDEYPFVRFSELQLAYEQGTALETQWRILRRASSVYRELIELAWRDPVLGKLFPYAGHRFVLAEDEFRSGELAGVFFVTDGWYRIYRRAVGANVAEEVEEGIAPEVEFEGDAGAIVAYLAQRLGSHGTRD